MTILYDINGYTQDDGIRISIQSETPFALGWSVRTNKIQSVLLGDLNTSKGAKNSRTFPLQVMIYGSSDAELDARLGSFYALIDQPVVTLGRTIDQVRRTAEVSLESVQDKPDYNPVAKTVKFAIVVTLRSVYWRDPAFTTVTLPNSTLTDTNQATNPGFETTAGTVELRRNLDALDPRGVTGTGWQILDPANSTQANVTGLASLPAPVNSISTGQQLTINTAATTAHGFFKTHGTAGFVAGDRIYVSRYVWSTVASSGSMTLGFGAAGSVNGTVTAIPANTWTRLSVTALIPVGFTTVNSAMYQTATWTVGSRLIQTANLLEFSGFLRAYVDGTLPATDPDWTSGWVGTVNASPSTITAVGVASVASSSSRDTSRAYSSTVAPVSGTRSLAIITSPGTSNDNFAALASGWATLGVVNTFSFMVTSPTALPANRIAVRYGTSVPTITDVYVYWPNPIPANTPTPVTISVDFTGITALSFLRIMNSSPVTEAIIRIDELMISTTGISVFWSGDTASARNVTYKWNAAANASTSVATYTAKTTDLAALAASTAPIADGKILVAGGATALTAFSIQDDNSGSGLSWESPPTSIGTFLSSEKFSPEEFSEIGNPRAFYFDPATGRRYILYTSGSTPNIRARLWEFWPDGSIFGLNITTTATSYTASMVRIGSSLLVAVGTNVYRYTIATGAVTATYPVGAVVRDIAVDSTGAYYILDLTGTVRKFSTSGAAGITWSAGGTTLSIGINSADTIYIGQLQASLGGGTIKTYSTAGVPGASFAAGDGAAVLSIHPDSGTGIWVAYQNVVEKRTAVGILVASFGSTGTGDGQLFNVLDLGMSGTDVLVMDSAGAPRIQKFDGDGIFNGVGAGSWLLIDVAKRRATIVTTASFDAVGDAVGGLSTVRWSGKKYCCSPRPKAADMYSREAITTVSQTGGGTAQVRVRGAFL